MVSTPHTSPVATFEPFRTALTRAAYKMLGSVAEAEDVVQDAFLRWLDADRSVVRDPLAFLHKTVTRLCLDELKSARVRREAYVGVWLPEPVVDEDPAAHQDIMLPLMMVLQRLSPLERAAFLLHDVFGASFEEVADTIGRAPATCRQLARRARLHVHIARPRPAMSNARGLEIAAAFFAASRSGDLDALRTLLTDDVAVYSDGGGKVSASKRPVVGLDDALKLHAALANIFSASPSQLVMYSFVNGLPGFVTVEQKTVLQTTAIDVDHGRIAAIYVTRNPDKLDHLRMRPALLETR